MSASGQLCPRESSRLPETCRQLICLPDRLFAWQLEALLQTRRFGLPTAPRKELRAFTWTWTPVPPDSCLHLCTLSRYMEVRRTGQQLAVIASMFQRRSASESI